MNASSSDDCDDVEKYVLRKKVRKRRKIQRLASSSGPTNKKLPMETVSEVESHSDDIVGVNDSDCSDSQLQTAILGHLHSNEGPFLSTISDSHLIDLLSGAENDGSYSSPLSNKSEKNMADFEDEDSPCEEELAQLTTSSHCLSITPRTRPLSINEHFHVKNKSSERNNSSISSSCKSIENNVLHKDSSGSGGSLINQLAYRVTDVCQPGNTLLWDLLMDDKIVCVLFFFALCIAE